MGQAALSKASVGEAKNKFSKGDYGLLAQMFEGLASRSSGDTMDKNTFLRFFDFPGIFGEQLFSLFDINGNGNIAFDEFIVGISAYLNGTTDEKVQLLFQLYDVSHDNCVSKAELRMMLLSLIDIPAMIPGLIPEVSQVPHVPSSPSKRPSQQKSGAKQQARGHSWLEEDAGKQAAKEKNIHGIIHLIVEDVFDTCDLNHNGRLSFDQFKLWMQNNEEHMNMVDIAFARHMWDRPSLPPRRRTRRGSVVVPGGAEGHSSIGSAPAAAAAAAANDASDSPNPAGHNRSHVCVHCSWGLRWCPSCGDQLLPSSIDVPFACGSSGKECSGKNIVGSLAFCPGCGKPWQGMESTQVELKIQVTACDVVSESSTSSLNLQVPDLLSNRKPLIPSDRPKVIKEGSLWKKRRHFRSFKQQWYVIRESFLYAFDKQESESSKHATFLVGMFIELPEEDEYTKQQRYGIDLINPERGDEKMTLFASSIEERTDWVRKLRRAAKTAPIDDHYVIGRHIGTGRFSKVYEGTSKHTGNRYAIKVIDKAQLDVEEQRGLRAEIGILRLVDHPHVMRMKQVFESHDHMYIVMTKVDGGDLVKALQALPNKHVDELVARNVMKQVFSGIIHLHERAIVHRDLKLDNILIVDASDSTMSHIVISDFGLSNFSAPEQLMQEACGTLAYMAPEVLMCRGYTSAVDAWACGMILYILLAGRLPFGGDDTNAVIDAIIECKVPFEEELWSQYSVEARDLVSKLLRKDPSARLTPEVAAIHPWFTMHLPEQEEFQARVDAAKQALQSVIPPASPLVVPSRNQVSPPALQTEIVEHGPNDVVEDERKE